MPQISQPCLPKVIFTVFLFRVLCCLPWHMKQLKFKDTRKELITKKYISHAKRSAIHIWCILSLNQKLMLSSLCLWEHWGSEKSSVQGSSASESQNQVVQLQTLTTTPHSLHMDAKDSQILKGWGDFEWHQKIRTPYTCSALHQFSHAHIKPLKYRVWY